jgi:outer membrane protein assembly factor BamB
MSCRSIAILTGILCSILCPRITAGDDAQDLARELMEKVGTQRGLCAVLGQGDEVSIELARSGFLVHVRDPQPERAESFRKQADASGLGISQLVVEAGRLDKLPYADHLVDLVVASRLTAEELRTLSPGEVLRVLRPEGVAIIASPADNEVGQTELVRWAAVAGDDGVSTWKDVHGSWIQLRKPPLEGTDDWSHWEKGPDNNPVSSDSVIKAPYRTQFLAGPYYVGMPAVTTAAGGRTFLAVGHIAHHRREWDALQSLIARNGYNGTVLWQRKLPEGYLVHRSAFVATTDTFYRIDGESCLMLDARTGEDKGRVQIPGLKGEWKWMVLRDDVLYVLAGKPDPGGAETTKGDREFGGWSWDDLSKGYYGKRIPFGFGDTLAAYDLSKKKRLWLHKEDTLIDSRGMALLEDQLYLYCPDRHFRSLRASTGEKVWTNGDSKLLELIEAPGKKLLSTPGFRTACITVATPKALIVQGQTRMNVVAISTKYGYLLWNKEKITNNPNAVFIDDNVILGVGKDGNNVVIEPESGEVLEDLKFRKAGCTRMTATPDSLFCRGEGTLRYDRANKKVTIDGAVRPACNDGAMAAGGILYLGPWPCDCNLSLIGCVAKCSAGDFRVENIAREDGRLELGNGSQTEIAALSITAEDWPTYRGNNQRTAATKIVLDSNMPGRWHYSPGRSHVPSSATSAGGLIFLSGSDGKVRALDAKSGELRWQYLTSGTIKYPPTIWEGRAYVGSGDGYVYALEATTGRLLWRFLAAPEERHILVYGAVTSTWPVASGVLVDDGVAYFAAGIVDYDGTHVYALDARTGAIRWQNHTSGHLNAELRKGVSVQGNLALQGNRLVLAAGNQVSPASFDLETGACLAKPREQGGPQAPSGRFVGVFGEQTVIAGGRVLYSAPENVANKNSFMAFSGDNVWRLNFGGIPPAWDGETVAWINHRFGTLTCYDATKVAERIGKGYLEDDRNAWRATLSNALEHDEAVRWETSLGGTSRLEVVSLALSSNAVVVVARLHLRNRTQPQWIAGAVDVKDGKRLFRHELPSAPLPDGLLVDRKGRVVVTLLNGDVIGLGSGA